MRFPSPIADPIPVTPSRGRNSVRLTTHLDMHSEPGGALLINGAARELRTNRATTEELAAATMAARLGKGQVLTELEATPHDERTGELLGKAVGSGFRSAVREVFREAPHEDALELLLDDLPAAALISGYASLYSGEMKIAPKHLEAGLLRPNVCSGWQEDGTMLARLRANGRFPIPLGPPANILEPSDDALAWHRIEPLGPGAMRRRRLIDVTENEPALARSTQGNGKGSLDLHIFAMFRDTHVDRDGVESILHEYSLSASLDPTTWVISNCDANPSVLPWEECPAAARSAGRLNGLQLDELSTFVSRELRGTTTCTHLNDLLRSLSKVTRLLSCLSGVS